jgi:hypothetical protein
LGMARFQLKPHGAQRQANLYHRAQRHRRGQGHNNCYFLPFSKYFHLTPDRM